MYIVKEHWLTEAIAQFKNNYEQFAKKYRQFSLIELDECYTAFQKAEAGDDIKNAARPFEKGVRAAMQTVEKKRKLAECTWTARVGSFLTKLYPIARLSLSLATASANVGPNDEGSDRKGASFAPLQGAAGGLGIILQVQQIPLFGLTISC